MVNIPKEVLDVISAADSAKMLATVDAEGVPNVVPVWSIVAVDSETIAFAELFIKKTKENLEKNKKVAIAIFKGPNCHFQRTHGRISIERELFRVPNVRTYLRKLFKENHG
ncbi:MAG: pyridoxamine 5'-phosphate oxidase family protein [Candidatus Bathyarchaeia archaeon]